jgi:two-component system CheB/CheR fusion protein
VTQVPENLGGVSGANAITGDASTVALVAELTQTRERLAEAMQEVRRLEELRHQSKLRETALEHELQHRVRNMLAKIRSLFSRTMDSASSLEEATNHFRGRMDTLSKYQGEVTRSPTGSIDLEALVLDELLNFSVGGDSPFSVEGPAVALSHEMAENIGMAVHELATNAMKYGALSERNGHLAVRWNVSREPAARLSLEWRESGVAIVASAPLHSGFGREFIEQALPYQLNADTSFELRPGGLLCRISMLLGQERTPA